MWTVLAIILWLILAGLAVALWCASDAERDRADAAESQIAILEDDLSDTGRVKFQLLEREAAVAALKEAVARKDKEILRLSGKWSHVHNAHAELDVALRDS